MDGPGTLAFPLQLLKFLVEASRGFEKLGHLTPQRLQLRARFAGPKQQSHREQVQLRNQRINILVKLDKASNRFVREGLLGDLRAVSLTLGIEVPDVLLLNNDDPKQGKLEV